MAKWRENPTPEQRIIRAVRWAERQSFRNVAADLRHALADLKALPQAR
jgi:hypothetical protein